MNPLVSIIVPLYNCEKYIKKCMISLLKQSYEHIEIIVVNDGSTDGSNDIMQRFIHDYSRVKYISQPNHGVAHARNTALAIASGKYILFVDSDDYVGAQYIENMVNCAEENQSDLVISGFTMELENGRKKTALLPTYYERFQNETWAYRLSSCCGRLYLKEFWDKYHLEFMHEEEARAEDVPIALFANAMADNIAIVPNAEYYYVQRAGSAMHNKSKKVMFLFPYEAFRSMYKRVTENTLRNGKDFFDMGILKFLAQFEFVIYRKADHNEKRRFANYIVSLLRDDFSRMVKNWRRLRKKCGLPITHIAAIELFIIKYRRLYSEISAK